MPLGATFPFDFGFVPEMLGGDGDPLDGLLLMDEPAFAGCLVPARRVGVIEAEQNERDDKTTLNDRLIAVACKSLTLGDITSVKRLKRGGARANQTFFYFLQRSQRQKIRAARRIRRAKSQKFD